MWCLINEPCDKSSVTNLAVKIKSDFKLDKQMKSVVKSGSFQLRLLFMVKSFLLFPDFERVIDAFITICLDYCNALYIRVSQDPLHICN